MDAGPITVRSRRNILLASDLSCRCDRALGRAALLAKRWHAGVLALHVLEQAADVTADGGSDLPSWRRAPDHWSRAENQLRGDVSEHVPEADVVIVRGDPRQAILSVAAQHDVDVIVTGITRSETFGRLLSGTTVRSLTRKATVPILVVRNRPRREYQSIVVATDFSAASQAALDAALRLFPGSHVVLFHAFQMPGRGIPHNDHSVSQFRQIVEREAHAFLVECALTMDFDKARVKLVLEHGEVAWLLRDYVRAKNVDLVVAGTQRRSAFMEVLVGSVTQRFLEMVECDMMIVRQARPA